MLNIPADRLLYPRFERLLGAPAKLGFQLCSIDGIALIVTGPVGDIGYEATMIGVGGPQFVPTRADLPDNVNVALLVPAADIVGFSKRPFFQHQAKRRGVIAT